MSPDREPTACERAAAVRHHQETCTYPGYGHGDWPLNDSDPLDRYLPEDLEAVRDGDCLVCGWPGERPGGLNHAAWNLRNTKIRGGS